MLSHDVSEKNRRKTAGYYLINLFIVISAVVILDFIIGSILHHYYFKINHESNFRTTYVLEQTRADILIFGSSRANYHYVAPLISQKLHLTCYNAGLAGNFIFYEYGVLQGVLKRYTPKAIILDVIPEDFDYDPSSYDRISTLLPYYRTHPELRDIIELKSKYEKVKLLSKIYPFNSGIIRIITGNIDLHNKQDAEMVNMGYVSSNLVWKEAIQPKIFNNEIDTIKIKYFKKFIDECQQAHIQIYLFVSPFYGRITGKARFIQMIREFADEKNIPFWDYSQDQSFLVDPAFFADPGHLSTRGAAKYSQLVIDAIKDYETKHLTVEKE